MCGIVGLMNWGQGAVTQLNMGIFMNMVWADAARGMHGTGAFAVADDGSNYRIRVAGPPHKLIDSPEFEKFDEFIQKKWVRAVVGHNRFATRGGVSTETSHPFRSADGKILLVHNGTLDSFSQLPDSKKFNVDSEAICHAISVQGVEKTIKTLRGAWALVWFDENDKTVNFLRNSERPLYIARHEKDPFMAWASEPGMLQWCLNRNGIYFTKIDPLPENQLYSYKLDSAKPHVKEVKGVADIKSTDGYWQGWDKNGREDAVGKGKSLVEEDKKVVYLPRPPTRTSSVNDSNTASGGTSTKGGPLLPKKPKGSSGAGSAGKGFWTAAPSIHDLFKGANVDIVPLEFKAIETDKARTDGIFQIMGISDNYPDIEFFCNIKGSKSVDQIMEAAKGMRGSIKSILKSMNLVARFPHQIYLENPVPLYEEDPKIPEHAYSDKTESGS